MEIACRFVYPKTCSAKSATKHVIVCGCDTCRALFTIQLVHEDGCLLERVERKGGVMNQAYWFEGLFGQTRCRIGVTRKGDTWIAEAFAVALSAEIAPVLNANGNVRSFPIRRRSIRSGQPWRHRDDWQQAAGKPLRLNHRCGGLALVGAAYATFLGFGMVHKWSHCSQRQ